MAAYEGESGEGGEERWEGGAEDWRMEVKVSALSSGVEPRTAERGWVGRPKSFVGWIEPVVILPFSNHQVYKGRK